MASFRSSLQTNTCLIGTFVSFNDPYSAQILAQCGFDWLMIDMEHSPLSAQEITAMVHSTVAASAGSCSPIVRIPSHGVEWIKWALDSGASGIIVPMVNTKQEVDGIIKRALYPPAGQRSYGPFRTPFAEIPAPLDVANYKRKRSPDVMILPMIESKEAVENAEDIIGADGVDGIFIGPVDLRHSLGFEGAAGKEPEYIAALQKVLQVGKKLVKPIGILGSRDSIPHLVNMGFSFIMLPGGDAGILAEAASALLKASKKSIS
ncbi:uncharacterized protein Z519_02842 [Cladophialophora bantiana CBS 173.52]|uniref:HpcH/HpaI aldolase/citrate lyase domain-containing protein n=1 Tax=Cladophialophora bantiana (strain ATCC 10958 / CBS 173.52 / CDC B-1940 / NIH 8579) TaxID=1442370 RepID=A0A0D2HQQ3_CLAB1|nr:uncharacterized protein Z519_02842 [Cladophialophora bantiana CBS 173.52]KIW95778.1 hypothetical protein Z519_02842 [Cladophialophora bantiana CBS 173.52]